MAYTEQPIVVGSTIDFTVIAKKDGSVWDISGATVTLYLRKPDGTVLSPLTATVSNGPAGTAHYQTDNDDLDVAGDWARQWKIVKSGIELKTKIIPFTVDPALV